MDSVWEQLLWAYRAREPVRPLWRHVASVSQHWTDVTFQEDVIKMMEDTLNVRYAPLLGYARRFLKVYLELLDERRVDIADILMDRLVKLDARVGHQEPRDLFYCIYRVRAKGSTDAIPVRVSPDFSDLGLNVWDAGLTLAELAIHKPMIFEGKHVLEIGCGVGLTGVCVARYATPRTLTLTDYQPRILSNTFAVLTANDLHPVHLDLAVSAPVLPHVKLSLLDIEKINEETLCTATRECDVIVGADLTYDPHLMQCLAHVLASILARSHAVAYIAAKMRNETTFLNFLHDLDTTGLHYESIPTHDMPLAFRSSDRQDVVILCITWCP